MFPGSRVVNANDKVCIVRWPLHIGVVSPLLLASSVRFMLLLPTTQLRVSRGTCEYFPILGSANPSSLDHIEFSKFPSIRVHVDEEHPHIIRMVCDETNRLACGVILELDEMTMWGSTGTLTANLKIVHLGEITLGVDGFIFGNDLACLALNPDPAAHCSRFAPLQAHSWRACWPISSTPGSLRPGD